MRLIPTSITQKLVGTPDPNDPTGGMTLDALMLRQKQLQQNAPTVPNQIASPWQGLSLMANTFTNKVQQERAQAEEAAGRQKLAQAMTQTDPTTGEILPAAEATVMGLDPDLGAKIWADRLQARRQQAQQEHEDAMKREGWGHEDIMAQRKLEAEQAAAGIWKPSDIGALRDDYTKAATTYDQAAPSWQSMKEAAGTALGKTADEQGKGAADYNMIVGFAKLLDPNSVVREGEVSSATNLGGYIDTVKGWLNQWKANGGKLDNNVRLAIMTQANSRMKSYYDQVKQKHDWITGVAGRHNVRPEDVVPPLGEFGGWEKPVEFMTDAELKAAAAGGQ